MEKDPNQPLPNREKVFKVEDAAYVASHIEGILPNLNKIISKLEELERENNRKDKFQGNERAVYREQKEILENKLYVLRRIKDDFENNMHFDTYDVFG